MKKHKNPKPVSREPQVQNQVQVQSQTQEQQPKNLKIPIIIFWSAIALSVAVSWALAEILNKHEYIVERWTMVGLGIFLIIFLFKLK
jgi:hypothetical protein